MTPEKLVEELDQAVQVPGLANVWVPPIRTGGHLEPLVGDLRPIPR